MSRIKKIIDKIYRIPGNVSIQEIYQEIDTKEMIVEPLSKNQTIEDFILEGGTGFNSLVHGRLGKSILEIRARYDGKVFTYGLPFSTLYATGYPLQRIIEGSRSNDLIKPFDRIEYITVPFQEKREVSILWKKSEYAPFSTPRGALNSFYMNTQGAKLLGMKGGGFFAVLPKSSETSLEGWEDADSTVWDQRFFIDSIEDETSVAKVFTQMSSVSTIHEKFIATSKNDKNAIFFDLATLLGHLVCISGSKESIEKLTEEIQSLKLTYRIA